MFKNKIDNYCKSWVYLDVGYEYITGHSISHWAWRPCLVVVPSWTWVPNIIALGLGPAVKFSNLLWYTIITIRASSYFKPVGYLEIMIHQ